MFPRTRWALTVLAHPPTPLRAVLLAGALVLALAAPAAASSSPAGAAPAAAGVRESHCVLAAGTSTATCYDTFPAAISAATKGRVRAPATAAAALTDASFAAALNAPATTAGTTITGIEYLNSNYSPTNTTLVLTAPGPCDNSLDADWVWNSLPAGWNDTISSFRSYSNCATQLFRNTNRGGGALTGILSSTSYVGAPANDQASSLTAN